MTNYSTRVYDDGSHGNYAEKNKINGRQTRADFYNATHLTHQPLPRRVTRSSRSFKTKTSLEGKLCGGKK